MPNRRRRSARRAQRRVENSWRPAVRVRLAQAVLYTDGSSELHHILGEFNPIQIGACEECLERGRRDEIFSPSLALPCIRTTISGSGPRWRQDASLASAIACCAHATRKACCLRRDKSARWRRRRQSSQARAPLAQSSVGPRLRLTAGRGLAGQALDSSHSYGCDARLTQRQLDVLRFRTDGGGCPSRAAQRKHWPVQALSSISPARVGARPI